MILNASAENGSSSDECLSISFPSRSVPLIEGISVGAGMYSTIASSNFCTPLLRYAEPQHTGTAVHSHVALRRTFFISSTDGSSPSRYCIMRSSSNSQIFSISSVRYSAALSAISPRSSVTVISSPFSSL